MRRWAIGIGVTLFLVAWVNFTAFWCVSFWLDGNAIIGKVENGRYYLGSHGRYTEVSQEVWTYSRAHTISTWITDLLGAVGFVWMIWVLRKTGSPDQPAQLTNGAGGGK
jgi:hypothetical protein